MADLIIGVQGSGKSYRAVKHIFDKRTDYVQILTNINEIEINGNIHQLNFDNFIKDIITPLHNMFKKNSNISDKELNMEFNILSNISDGLKLIIVDEAQNFFNKKNDVINWFVTYHRHFNIELILISQLVIGIHSDHRIFNNVYEALNPSKQFLPNKIRYSHYLGLPANSSNYLKRDNLVIDDEVFTLYGSGGKVKKKNVIILPIILLFILIVFLGFGFKYVITMFDSDEHSSLLEPISLPKNSLSFDKYEDIKTASVIYRYFVDEDKSILSCENGLSVPLMFVPSPRYKITSYLSMKSYYYISPIKYCMIIDDKKEGVSVNF